MIHPPIPRCFPGWRAATATLALSALATLAACGGSDPIDEALAAAPGVPALFDQEGHPLASLAGLAPADPAARTRLGLYATRAQYEWEALTVPQLTVLLDMDDIGSVDLAVQDALRLRDWHQADPAAAPLAFYVRSRHGAEAARVADLLAEQGIKLVFAIVPTRPR